MIVTLSSIGLPLTNGFVGEFLILLGTYRWDWRFGSLAASGVILSAVYMLWMFQRVNYGEVSEKNRSLPDLKPREWALLVPVINSECSSAEGNGDTEAALRVCAAGSGRRSPRPRG